MTHSRLRKPITCPKSSPTNPAEELLSRLLASPAFEVSPNVPGHSLWQYPWEDAESPQADLLLQSTPWLLERCWNLGTWVIQLRREGRELSADWRRTTQVPHSRFLLNPKHSVIPEWAFLFPAHSEDEASAEVLAQFQVGTICLTNDSVVFVTGHHKLLTLYANGSVQFAPWPLVFDEA